MTIIRGIFLGALIGWLLPKRAPLKEIPASMVGMIRNEDHTLSKVLVTNLLSIEMHETHDGEIMIECVLLDDTAVIFSVSYDNGPVLRLTPDLELNDVS